MKLFCLALFLSIFAVVGASAQTNQQSYPAQESPQTVAQEIAKISKAVQNLNANFKDFLEKTSVGKGMQLSERQQKLLLGFEVLNRAEQRLEVLQKFQIELTQKDGEVKTRLAQIEEQLIPGGIERNIAVIGTTRTEELRETRKNSLETERRNLRNLTAQINRNLQQNNDELQKAENLVQTLRRKILPQIEAEISDL